MICLVVYDVHENVTRSRVARYLLSKGKRIQKSVFAVELGKSGVPTLLRTLERLADDADDVAVFELCSRCALGAVRRGKTVPSYEVF